MNEPDLDIVAELLKKHFTSVLDAKEIASDLLKFSGQLQSFQGQGNLPVELPDYVKDTFSQQ
jgi:hypothetical protein